MESPMIEKKFSSSSQRTVGPTPAYSQQAIQRHNFLMPKDEQTTIQLPNYRGQENEKSKSPIAIDSKFNNSANNYENRGGFSTEKRAIGFGR